MDIILTEDRLILGAIRAFKRSNTPGKPLAAKSFVGTLGGKPLVVLGGEGGTPLAAFLVSATPIFRVHEDELDLALVRRDGVAKADQEA